MFRIASRAGPRKWNARDCCLAPRQTDRHTYALVVVACCAINCAARNHIAPSLCRPSGPKRERNSGGVGVKMVYACRANALHPPIGTQFDKTYKNIHHQETQSPPSPNITRTHAELVQSTTGLFRVVWSSSSPSSTSSPSCVCVCAPTCATHRGRTWYREWGVS